MVNAETNTSSTLQHRQLKSQPQDLPDESYDQFEDAVEAMDAVELNEDDDDDDDDDGCINNHENEDEKNQEGHPIQTLEQAIEEIHQVLTGALDNRFQEALKIAQKRSEYSVYHSLGETVLHFLKAVLTLEKDQVDGALQSASRLFELCGRAKKQHYLGLIWRPNYNNYTDYEVHAELCYAESLLMVALLTFLENQSLLNLVKGAFRFRSCYQAYKECQNILNTRTQWGGERSRRDFEAGVRMGVGTFNLVCSHLPGKVLKVLEFIGFSGNRAAGLIELDRSVRMHDCLRSPIAVLISATYHCYIEHYFGLGDGDVDYMQQMLSAWLHRYPNSAFFLLFSGRLSVLKGEINNAIVDFSKCIKIQEEWKQLHNICYWELLWCYCIKCDWTNACKYADILRDQCAWSPAIYTYQSAVFLMMMQDEKREQLRKAVDTKSHTEEQLNEWQAEVDARQEQIDRLMRMVPTLRIRYAGKTIPAEKFAITHAEKYFAAGNHLLLPAFEYIYIWNIFAIIEKDTSLVSPILERIQAKIVQYIYEEENEEESTDNICLLYLLQGVCLRILGQMTESKQSFIRTLQLQKRVKMATFIAPHSCMELGLTCLRTNELEEANAWFEKAKRDYSGYLIEMIVHFRVHCGQRVLKNAQRKLLAEQSVEELQTNAIDSGNVSTAGETNSSSQSEDGQNSIHSTEDDHSNDESIDCKQEHSSADKSMNNESTPVITSSTNKSRPLTTGMQRTDAKPVAFLEEIEQASNQL